MVEESLLQIANHHAAVVARSDPTGEDMTLHGQNDTNSPNTERMLS